MSWSVRSPPTICANAATKSSRPARRRRGDPHPAGGQAHRHRVFRRRTCRAAWMASAWPNGSAANGRALKVILTTVRAHGRPISASTARSWPSPTTTPSSPAESVRCRRLKGRFDLRLAGLVRFPRIGHDGCAEDRMNEPKNTIDKADEAQLLGHHRPLGRARGGAARQGVRPCRPLAGRAGRADEGARPVRRHRQPGLRRARPAGAHLRQDRDAHLVGVDGAHRHLQLAPDAGARRREVRHRAAEAPLAAQARLGRGARRAGAHRARCRHRPAGDPADRAARRRPLCASTAPRPGSPTASRARASRCWSRPTPRPSRATPA